LREVNLETMMKKRPEEVIRHAVKGMLPKNKLADKILTKLKVYAGPTHPHAAQLPKDTKGAQPRKETKEKETKGKAKG
jgi:large subunit ribosomal protein L13